MENISDAKELVDDFIDRLEERILANESLTKEQIERQLWWIEKIKKDVCYGQD